MFLEIVETIALIPTAIVLLWAFIQIFILVFLRPKRETRPFSPPISVLVPAHNEGKYIGRCIDSILNSGYKGRLEVIAIDDGSADNTPDVLKSYRGRIRVLRTDHIGKSNALNKALRVAKNDIVLTIDGDTCVDLGALDELVKPFRDKAVGATTGALKIENRRNPLTWFQRVEYFYYALYKDICDRVGGMIWTLGTLSAFRRRLLIRLGGFSNKLYAEDIDISLRILKSGLKVVYAPKARCSTFVPEKLSKLIGQRVRWSRGVIQISKRHSELYFNRRLPGAGFFSLPMMSYWYFHAVAIIILMILQIVLGYYQYFLSNGVVFSFDVALFIFGWLSVFGVANLAFNIAIGNWAITLLSVMNIIAVSASLLLYIYSIRWYRERPGLRDLFAIFFLPVYWWITMSAQFAGSFEWLKKEGRNWWKK